MRAGKVSDHLYHLHAPPAWDFFRASGTPEELAERCADWFESLLSRPVVRTEWLGEAATYATRWEFADTAEALVASGVTPPEGPPSRRVRVRPRPAGQGRTELRRLAP
ncbi:hypothetical protein OG875_09760 [Streptomyces sp. NBC_01498]|uniref:hypothetical protein n=1 Tax=Streptomyces sp. NBC_01498 TaxID=2975870 RepID=UPI002E7AE8AB|nr:hypothetical protein [Streptomyces sp. NBC_01498]WTL24861.1 hypothetical protein OG875_09760 [Streptomyces sp. NBC_01498]